MYPRVFHPARSGLQNRETGALQVTLPNDAQLSPNQLVAVMCDADCCPRMRVGRCLTSVLDGSVDRSAQTSTAPGTPTRFTSLTLPQGLVRELCQWRFFDYSGTAIAGLSRRVAVLLRQWRQGLRQPTGDVPYNGRCRAAGVEPEGENVSCAVRRAEWITPTDTPFSNIVSP